VAGGYYGESGILTKWLDPILRQKFVDFLMTKSSAALYHYSIIW